MTYQNKYKIKNNNIYYSKEYNIENLVNYINKNNYNFILDEHFNKNELKSYDFILRLNKIKTLKLLIFDKSKLNFNILENKPSLEELYILCDGFILKVQEKHHLKKLILSECKTKNSELLTELEGIEIWSYKEKSLEQFKDNLKLKVIDIRTGSIKSLKGIENLKKLKILRLGNCRYLTDITTIKDLKNLKELEMQSCPKLHDLSILGNLKNLEKLIINNCNDIDSIKFVKDLPKLKYLELMQSTNILDNDMAPAINIEELFYNPRKAYNIEILKSL